MITITQSRKINPVSNGSVRALGFSFPQLFWCATERAPFSVVFLWSLPLVASFLLIPLNANGSRETDIAPAV